MRCEIVFYKNTRKQSAYDLQDIKTQTMRQFQKNMQELSCLQKACQTATNIMSQAEILQGRISGTPQKFFFDDFDLTPMLQERLKSLEGRNEEKYSNKRASIENCKEILELQKRCEEMKEQAVLIQKKTKKIEALNTKVFQYLKKLQTAGVTNYREWTEAQKSDFKTMVYSIQTLQQELRGDV
ncbi:MAG TPA: hypothetical protein DGZ34_10820 [Lachnospiraceae bacterium]|jgi:hypothetical protein|nr:hypothetical protein [Lachnospiraceae bacterium]